MEFVNVSRTGRVGILEMSRPDKRNALSFTMKQEMVVALGELDRDTQIRAIVIWGGPSVFAAGSDVTEIVDITPFQYRESHRAPRIWDVVEKARLPVIAAINGVALGGGCELALACDVRVAGESARLGQPEIKLGLIPGAGGTQRLPRLVGEGQAMRMILTGEALRAQDAFRIGLVDEVVQDAAVLDTAVRTAQDMARHSRIGLELAKEAVKAARRMPLDAGLAYERQLMALAFASTDAPQRIREFVAPAESLAPGTAP